jgi:hypothetical protein
VVFARHNVDAAWFIGQARFLKHDANLHPIRRRSGKELQPIRVNVSRVRFDVAGTCSGFGNAVLAIAILVDT